MDLDDLFNFGKHKGDMLEDVIEDDPNYIAWLVDNTNVVLSDEALELITKKGIA